MKIVLIIINREHSYEWWRHARPQNIMDKKKSLDKGPEPAILMVRVIRWKKFCSAQQKQADSLSLLCNVPTAHDSGFCLILKEQIDFLSTTI